MAIIEAKRAVTAGIAVLTILLICSWAYRARPHARETVSRFSQTARPDRAGILESYGKLPLRFESNVGQIRTDGNGQVKFLAHGQGYTLLLTGADAVLKLRASATAGHESQGHESQGHESRDEAHGGNLQMKLLGANPGGIVQGADELPSRSNYFIGSDPGQWHTDVPNFASVRYRDVYPGIDLVYYGNQGTLEYDFIVAPGADPNAIQLEVGAQLGSSVHPPAPLRIDDSGDLVVQGNGGEVRFRKPVVYQPETDDSSSRAATAHAATTERSWGPDSAHSTRVETRYKLEGSHQVRFEIGEYDRNRPLVIDPTLSYSSYLGGSSLDQGNGIAVDPAGNAYVTGCTGVAGFSVHDRRDADHLRRRG